MYCYFCHGYSGDAKTVASQYLSPGPRDFTSTPLLALSTAVMRDVVRDGKVGTAMMSFSLSLTQQQIEDVVVFVRRAFMAGEDSNTRYHTVENGWENHDRYQSAFPFVLGELAIDMLASEMTLIQRQGFGLFLSTCITCHEGREANPQELLFDTRPVSFPRATYSHKDASSSSAAVDSISAASPYARHDIPPVHEKMSADTRRGEAVFQQNCAFCHAADGSGKNWIGSFLEPHPRDLSDGEFISALTKEGLRIRIREGLPGTTMPAWAGVLSDSEIDAVVSYIFEVIAEQ